MNQLVIALFMVLVALSLQVDVKGVYRRYGDKLSSGQPLNINDGMHYTDCDQVRMSGGYSASGVYVLHVNKTYSFKVYCEHAPHISYTVIQRRVNGAISFNREFVEYDQGFGTLDGDFWVGLDQIYYLTNKGSSHNVLTIKMATWDNEEQTVRYSFFRMTNDIDYTLQIGGFSGNIEDDFSFNNDNKFATYDSPNPGECPAYQHAGWWYSTCSYILLNGIYYQGGQYTPNGSFYDGIFWKGWRGFDYSLKFVSMSLSQL